MLKTRMVLLAFTLLSMLIGASCSDDPVSPVTTGTIEGRVIDAETGNPIAMASITTTPGTIAITSDSSGAYYISDIEAGQYSVRATKLGYKSSTISVIVNATKITQVEIILEKEPAENKAPLAASNPSPANGASNLDLSLRLSWTGTDLNVGDSLTYDLYLGCLNSSMALIASNLTDTVYTIDALNYQTRYYWQVVTIDEAGTRTYGPVWSFVTIPFPDHRLVFASNRDGNYAIYSASDDDGANIKLCENSHRNWWPRISPNRNLIAYTSNRTVDSHIYVMDLHGVNEKKITRRPVAGNHNYGIGFCWSPDGTQLLYPHFERLYRIDADGSNLVQIASAPADKQFRECDWSPLGDKLVALVTTSSFYDSEIYLMDTDGTNMTLIMENSPGAMLSPMFAPDGKRIVFTQDVTGHESSTDRQLDSHVFILHIDGSDTIDVSTYKPAGTNDLYPRWSPDGAKIIFCNGANDDVTPKEIWIMHTDGTERKKLIDDGIMPDWR